MNNVIFESMDIDLPERRESVRDPGRDRATAKIPPYLLRPGRFTLSFFAFIQSVKVFERREAILRFYVSETDYGLNAYAFDSG